MWEGDAHLAHPGQCVSVVTLTSLVEIGHGTKFAVRKGADDLAVLQQFYSPCLDSCWQSPASTAIRGLSGRRLLKPIVSMYFDDFHVTGLNTNVPMGFPLNGPPTGRMPCIPTPTSHFPHWLLQLP